MCTKGTPHERQPTEASASAGNEDTRENARVALDVLMRRRSRSKWLKDRERAQAARLAGGAATSPPLGVSQLTEEERREIAERIRSKARHYPW